jgi:CRP-like cAMP-binding protein
VFDEADTCHSVFVICEGRVKLVTASKEGRLLLLRFASRGEILGLAEAILGNGTPYDVTAIAATPSTFAVIPRDTFMRFIGSNGAAACRITVALSEQYKEAQREEKFLGLGETSTSRLAHLLLGWSVEPMRVTHTDLANAIGSTRETVTRIMSHLSHRGIVERTPEGIVVHSREELSRLAS